VPTASTMARPYPSQYGDYGRSRDGFHRRPSVASEPPFNHSRKSWTDNGVHYTVETGTYTGPGLSFSAASSSATGLFGAFTGSESRSSRHAFGAGLLETAAGLLGAVSGLHQAIGPRSLHAVDGECRDRFDEFDEQPESEDDTAYGDAASFSGTRPRSMFSRFRDKLNENRQRARGAPHTPETFPARHAQSRRQWPYTGTHDEPTDPHFDREDLDYQGYDRRRPGTRTSYTDDTLSALRQNMEHYRAQVKRSREALERASRQWSVDIRSLQALLDEVKMLERASAAAEQEMQAEQDRARRTSHQGRQQHHRQPCRRHRAPPTPPDDNDDLFSAAGFGYVPIHINVHQGCPSHAGFNDFHDPDPFGHAMFGAFGSPFGAFGSSYLFHDNVHRLFGMPSGPQFNAPRAKWPRFNHANGGPLPQTGPGFAGITPPPTLAPPRTCLLPDEAKRLFRMYNERWNALSPTDPNIPYPARGLLAAALQDGNSIWAPMVDSPLTTWSEETLMQANAQAFYLGVVGMKPQYSEAGGKVSMAYDKAEASPAQVKQLVDLLKREKTRWHSDRLGRRNKGVPGPNEGLQSDPRARAVFHAVCELMECVQ